MPESLKRHKHKHPATHYACPVLDDARDGPVVGVEAGGGLPLSVLAHDSLHAA